MSTIEMPTGTPDFGSALKERRLELGLRQEDVAELVGVSQGHYSGWEGNRHGFLGNNEERLEAALQLPPGGLRARAAKFPRLPGHFGWCAYIALDLHEHPHPLAA